jgi:fructoselysine-6-P-deglycase FrlB-like protein
LAKYAIEHWTRLPVEVELASEFRYRDPVLDRSTLVIAISQSGETADTLEAVRHAKKQKAKVLAICNTNGSQIPRECDAVLYTRAGPEIGVASTKTFLAQIAANYLVGLALAQARGTKYGDEVAREYGQLESMPTLVSLVLDDLEPVAELGRRFASSSTVLFLGRHVGYPVALEGALKLKELAYMHAEGVAAGELKHGPIALIEDGLPVIVVMPSPKNAPTLHAKLLSNIREIQARGANHDRHRRGGRRDRAAVRRPPNGNPLGVNALPAVVVDDSAAGVRRVGGTGPRLRRRQTAQPGQVRHCRIIHNAMVLPPSSRAACQTKPRSTVSRAVPIGNYAGTHDEATLDARSGLRECWGDRCGRMLGGAERGRPYGGPA